jgi:predicted nucleic acid-binding protein
MQPALFDTSIYISALRRGNDAALALRRVAADAPLLLSSVVLEELYAGAGDRERRVLERLERDFDRVKRILVPNLSDWTQTGRVLARLVDSGSSRRTTSYLPTAVPVVSFLLGPKRKPSSSFDGCP